jgi:hypothetical protein
VVFAAFGAVWLFVGLRERQWGNVAFSAVFIFIAVASVVRAALAKPPPDPSKHLAGTREALALLGARGPEAGYRRAEGATRLDAATIYGPVMSTAPLPVIRKARGSTLAARLFARKEQNLSFTIPFVLVWNVFVLPIFAMGVRQIVLEPGKLAGWGITLFMSIFVGVGAAIWVPMLRRFLANRRLPTVEIGEEPVYLGAPLQVQIDHPSRTRLTRLQVSLVCNEVVTFMEGTTTRTERQEVATVPVLDEHDVDPNTPSHRAEGRLPENAPHSFASPNNKLEWAVRVHADIPNWPDYDELFVFRALPRPKR